MVVLEVSDASVILNDLSCFVNAMWPWRTAEI